MRRQGELITALREEIARVRSGVGDGKSLVAAFREAVVLLPQTADGSVIAGDEGGLWWVYAFTTEQELARWVVARGGDQSAEQPYLTVRGSRLLDAGVPEVGMPAGIALDIAGEQPMVFPPVHGIVADAVAVA